MKEDLDDLQDLRNEVDKRSYLISDTGLEMIYEVIEHAEYTVINGDE